MKDRKKDEIKEELTQCKDRRPNARLSLRGTINTISEGFRVGGASSSLRKRHLRVV